jgi:hypothetical protein
MSLAKQVHRVKQHRDYYHTLETGRWYAPAYFHSLAGVYSTRQAEVFAEAVHKAGLATYHAAGPDGEPAYQME